ncbi:MAG: DUF4115 domain-containing protein [Peptococcaceae bacterium]|nr:DUF4115 domain-containing protein [Peptococcaceae bacterium]
MNIGGKLKEAREARGLALEAVEEETKIRRKYLQAMEEEQFNVLPGPIYARAFLKNYARFLNLDVEEVMEMYNQRFVAGEAAPEAPDACPEERVQVKVPGKPRYWLFLAAAVVVMGLAFTVYHGAVGVGLGRPAGEAREEAGRGGPAGTPPADGGMPVPPVQTPAQQAPPANAAGVNLVLNVKNDRCWMRVDVDGSPAFQGMLSAGQSKSFEAREKISVTLGNAGAVEVLLNGQNLGFLGGDGDVVNREFTSRSRG